MSAFAIMITMEANSHYVYIVRCADGSFYCGYTTDVLRRVAEHNGKGNVAGARYTSGRRPVTLVYQESFVTRSKAQKREVEIKKLSKQDKLQLISRE
jgi:putative endonuclease